MIGNLNKKDQTRILASNYIGNLAYIYRDRPFIAPITYFFDVKNNIVIGYSNEGHKLKAMRQNEAVSLSVTEIDSVNNWDSVLAHGTFKEITGSGAKAQLHKFSIGVKDLIINKEHRKLDFINEFSSKIDKGDVPVVFHVKIEEITGKRRRTYQ